LKCELRIISGARAGQRDVYDKSYIGIGRHPLSDVRFDAEKDLDASTRHAAIVKTGDSFILRDLGSTNGTFVNGDKLTGDRPLKDGDAMRFGVHGPEVSFHLVREEHDEAEVIMQAVHAPAPGARAAQDAPKVNATKPEGLPVVEGASPRRQQRDPDLTPAVPLRPIAAPPSKTSVLRAEVAHEKSRFRALSVALLLLIIGAVGVVIWQGRQSNVVITGVQHQVDSLRFELLAMQRLKSHTDSEKTSLQAQLAAEHDPAKRAIIVSRIDTVTRRSAAIRAAQGVDYTAIRNRNDSAISIIFVRCADTTKMWTGTAFSVDTTGLMLTNRHVTTCEDGGPVRDIAVQFSGSPEVLPARLVKSSPDADISVVQLESHGPFPVIAGFAAAAPAEGAPIALIGFPGGGTHATLVTGTIVKVVPDSEIELDAFSGVGASGSPIFDRDGKVLGIEYGGRVGSGGRAIVGLPISRALGLLAR
jgi:pSer/pThr/pTyr-binding forkhead associated (FHA) protein/S1-C subfamily serine protease